MERQPLRIPPPGQDDRKKEWVSISWGDLCVWEMTVAETVAILERATSPRGGMDQGEAAVQQIILCCRVSDAPNADLVFDGAQQMAVYRMLLPDFEVIMKAINRVNGKDATEAELLRDFSLATREPNPSD